MNDPERGAVFSPCRTWRYALWRRFGGGKGIIASCGCTVWGVTGHCWSALAVAVTAWDREYGAGR